MDVALAVGGAFLSAFLQVAFDRIASSRKFIDFFQGKTIIKFDEDTLDNLEILLDTISAVLEDAENKQAKSPMVRRWLDKLKVAVNQADDLLDELNTECLRLKVDYEFQPKENKADPNVSDSKLSLKVDFIEELMPKLNKITDRLEYFVKQINVLGLQKFDPKEKGAYRVPSSSVVDKSQIFGRDEEKEKLIDIVLYNEGGASNVSVIPITGLGGVGKTTLAQLVYNDDRVKNKFQTTAWVCVSEDYDAIKITKSLLMEVNSSIVDDKDDFNRLQVKLRDNLAEKCFLIILDDVWNEDYNDWHTLKNPLNHGRRGSKIIITTRNEKVAKNVQNEPFHHMQPIPEDQSWCLFKSHAFDNETCTSFHEFEIIGKEIVKKCKGLPLAIKTVAGALRPKRDINEWHDILSSEIWAAGGDILPALSLSYKHLPSHLKCCFAFCAVFPKDIPYDKEEVILLWMANDFVQPFPHKSLKEVGQDYFEELRSRSLFEIVNVNKFLMHDLVNDLARYVSGNFCVRLQDYQDTKLNQGNLREIDPPQEVLHFSYLASRTDTSRKFRALAKVHSLRTFLPIIQPGRPNQITSLFFSDILPRLQHLRALTLSKYNIFEIPDSIGDLKHLRLLNLSWTNIVRLPNTLGKCLNLQTLILANCKKLVELPEDMRLLINLRHLDVRGVGNAMIERMNSWLSILKDTQNLSIIVDKIHDSLLDQLGKLQTCQSLVITGLEKVVNVEIAEKVELTNKSCIEDLTLEWSDTEEAECSRNELNIFAKLQPHTNTKHLTIKGYRGTSFGDCAFSNMKSLSLQDCKNCFHLPPLGQLTALKKLVISGLDGITEVGEEFYGNSSFSKPFQALEELEFSKMSEWAIWNTHSDIEFPSLKQLCIRDCPKLVGYNEIKVLTSLLCSPSLQVAKISDLPSLKKIPQGTNHLDELEVRGCPDLVSIPNHVDNLTIIDCPSLSLSLQSYVVKRLYIRQCGHIEFPASESCNSYLECIEMWGYSIEVIPLCSFSELRKVGIYSMDSPRLFKFPNGNHQTLTALQSLNIFGCDNILSFPEGGLPAPNLKEFCICSCEKLKSLPEQMHTQLSSLRELEINDCPEIKCFPEGGLPFSLETLNIVECKKLMISQADWGLQRLPSLTTLFIEGDDYKLFAEEMFPTSLTTLFIRGVDDKSFPEEGLLPANLRDLHVNGFLNLEVLNHKGLQHLTSLQRLTVGYCPNLRYFPEEKLSSSLFRLWIYGCPKLEARMEREKGEDWPKVSHIPVIQVDSTLIS